MNNRIKQLRKNSLEAVNYISTERAELLTEFYNNTDAKSVSVPVMRAMAFQHILENKKIWIGEGELIVGERGPEPKATPTYPEVCLHSIHDLEILDSRPKVSFKSDEVTRKIYSEQIIPYWKGKSQRDLIFNSMKPEWIAAYEAGVFTEFQEQRAPGHTVLGDKIYYKGLLDLISEIDQKVDSLNKDKHTDNVAKLEELKAMRICALALIRFAGRYADAIFNLASETIEPLRKAELLQMAEVCRNVPANSPRSFHEALQYYWFVHVGVITELNPWDSFNPGRLDQHLYPFYKKDLAGNKLTRESATELLQAFWIKFNNPL